MTISAKVREFRCSWAISRLRPLRAGGAVTTGVPRRFTIVELGPLLADLFNPEFAPARRTYITVDQCALIGFLKKRAVAALLVALRCVLVLDRRLFHFGFRLPQRQQRGCGSSRASCAAQKNNSPGNFVWSHCPWLDHVCLLRFSGSLSTNCLLDN
jgi:hypothetical protein